jgi:hypothetical protein
MQNDDFLSGCARTMELSIKGQQLLTRDMACGLRRLWRRMTLWADGNGPVLPRMHPPT